MNALAAADAATLKRYALVSMDGQFNESNLYFLDLCRSLDHALALQGFVKVQPPDVSDVTIMVAFEAEEPVTKEYSYTVPIHGQTGVASSQTHGNVSVWGNSANYSTQTYYTPRYGTVGYETKKGQLTFCTKSISIRCVKPLNQAAGDVQEVWRLIAFNNDEETDLRAAVPYLVAAARPYFAKPTPGGWVAVSVSESDAQSLLVGNPD